MGMLIAQWIIGALNDAASSVQVYQDQKWKQYLGDPWGSAKGKNPNYQQSQLGEQMSRASAVKPAKADYLAVALASSKSQAESFKNFASSMAESSKRKEAEAKTGPQNTDITQKISEAMNSAPQVGQQSSSGTIGSYTNYKDLTSMMLSNSIRNQKYAAPGYTDYKNYQPGYTNYTNYEASPWTQALWQK